MITKISNNSTVISFPKHNNKLYNLLSKHSKKQHCISQNIINNYQIIVF